MSQGGTATGVQQTNANIDAFRELSLKAREDERKSIEHFNNLLVGVNIIDMKYIHRVMPTLHTLVTEYGQMEVLNQYAPEGFMKCESFLNDVIVGYHERTEDLKQDKDPETTEKLRYRSKILVKLLGQWKTHYITPIIQFSRIQYKSMDLSSETTFNEILDRVKQYQEDVNLEPDSGDSKADVYTQTV